MEKRRRIFIRQRQRNLSLTSAGLYRINEIRSWDLLLHCIESVPAYREYRFLEEEIKADLSVW